MQKVMLKASNEIVELREKHKDGKRYLLRSVNGTEFIAEAKDFIALPTKNICSEPYGIKSCNNCSVPRCNPAHNDSSTPCLHYKLSVSARTGLSQANKTILASCLV